MSPSLRPVPSAGRGQCPGAGGVWELPAGPGRNLGFPQTGGVSLKQMGVCSYLGAGMWWQHSGRSWDTGTVPRQGQPGQHAARAEDARVGDMEQFELPLTGQSTSGLQSISRFFWNDFRERQQVRHLSGLGTRRWKQNPPWLEPRFCDSLSFTRALPRGSEPCGRSRARWEGDTRDTHTLPDTISCPQAAGPGPSPPATSMKPSWTSSTPPLTGLPSLTCA